MPRPCSNDSTFEECCSCVFDVSFSEESGLPSSSSVIDSVCGEAITDLRFLEDEHSWTRLWSLAVDALLGVAPRLTGVAGGNSLSNCSGLRTGPNETRLELLLVLHSPPTDFLFSQTSSTLSPIFSRGSQFTATVEKGVLSAPRDVKASSSSCKGIECLRSLWMFSFKLPPVGGVLGLPLGAGIFGVLLSCGVFPMLLERRCRVCNEEADEF